MAIMRHRTEDPNATRRFSRIDARRIGALCLVVSLTACVARPAPTGTHVATPPAADSPHASHGTAAIGDATPTAPLLPPESAGACRPAALMVRAGRDGETGVVHIGAAISNIGDAPCSLPVVPVRIELVPASGAALPLRVEPPLGDPSAWILIPPGVDDGADLIAYWTNWCGGAIGPLELRITFEIGEAAVPANLDGTLLARCDNPAGPATIQIDSVMTASP